MREFPGDISIVFGISSLNTRHVSYIGFDRTGFAFWSGRVPGAYKADGTPKDGAINLSITENTKNTVSLEVYGANDNSCAGLHTILD